MTVNIKHICTIMKQLKPPIANMIMRKENRVNNNA
jgi:hypothetical protein